MVHSMKAYKKIMDGISKVEIFFMVLITIVVTVITFVNVVTRSIATLSFSWSEELVINIFILMIMLGCALCTREGSMITLSLVFDNVNNRGKKILTVIDTIANLAFYGVLIWTGFEKTFSQIKTGKETFSLGWPEWVFTILLPVGSIFVALHAIEYMIDVLHGDAACLDSKEDKAE